MEIASLIISVLALIGSLACLTLMLAKNFFSSHTVQMVPVDPMKDLMSSMPEIGREMGNQFRDLGDPIDEEEREYLENIRKKKVPPAMI